MGSLVSTASSIFWKLNKLNAFTVCFKCYKCCIAFYEQLVINCAIQYMQYVSLNF